MKLLINNIRMGNEQDKLPHLQKTRIFEQTHHPPLHLPSSISILVSEQNEKTIEYTTKIEQKQICKRWQKQIKQYFTNIDTAMFYLPIRYHYKGTQMCSNAGIVIVQYQYLPTTLFRQIIARMDRRVKFGEGDLWRLLYVLTKAATELYRVGRKLGKIGLECVFMNNQTKDIRIATGLTFFSDCMIQQIIAPECLTHTMGTNKQYPDIKLSESFSIGIVVLCAILLNPKAPSTISSTLDRNQILKIQQMHQDLRNQQLYSKQLKDIIWKMTQVEVRNRLIIENVINDLQRNEEFMRYFRSSMQGNPISVNNKYELLNRQTIEKIFANQNKNNIIVNPSPLPSFVIEQGQQKYTNPQLGRIQKVVSQYIPYRNNDLQPNDPYSDFFAMVDSQLEKSRRSFPSP